MRQRRVAFAAALGLVALGVHAPSSANAATPERMPDESGEHCVAELAALPANAAMSQAAEPRDYRCFETFAESIAFATDDLLQLAPDDRSVSDEQLATVQQASANRVLVGVEYAGQGYSGGSLALYGQSGSCQQGTTYGFPRMADYGWENRISSARGYNNCVITHYSGTGYRGNPHGCYSSCSTLGSMNNKTSSIRFW